MNEPGVACSQSQSEAQGTVTPFPRLIVLRRSTSRYPISAQMFLDVGCLSGESRVNRLSSNIVVKTVPRQFSPLRTDYRSEKQSGTFMRLVLVRYLRQLNFTGSGSGEDPFHRIVTFVASVFVQWFIRSRQFYLRRPRLLPRFRIINRKFVAHIFGVDPCEALY